MAPPGICPQCGDRLPADVPHGVCPKCMLGLGFDDPLEDQSSGEQPTLDPGSRFIAPTPRELAPHFPQLEILDLVGQGGMGAVYRARQKTLDRIVALKILPSEVGRDPAFAERFTREAQALARLTHPNIVMVFDFGESDGYFYFLMEYVDGVNLRQALNAGHLTTEQALQIVPQICDALQYAHDEGIVHRDIKPENVLLDKRGNVKIADFGLAKLLGRTGGNWTLTGTGQVMGTPHYMAPEQLEKPTEVDHRADIYSLGVVFYELLTGELPLGRFAPPSQKTAVSADLDQVVLRTLEKEPNQRYQHASDVKTAVQTLGRTPRETPVVSQPPAAISDEFRRLRVPFSINELYAGFAKASGCIRFDGQNVTLEFQVKDDVVGYVSSGVKNVSIPLSEIVSLQLIQSWFGLTNNIEIMTDQLSTLEHVPRSEQGRATLQIARRDLPLAQRFVTAVQREMIRSGLRESNDFGRPPIVYQEGDQQEMDLATAARGVRGPALGLLVVGILSCLTPLMLPLVPMLWLSQKSVPEATVIREISGAPMTRELRPLSDRDDGVQVGSKLQVPPLERPAAAATSAETVSSITVSRPPTAFRQSWFLLALMAVAALLQVAVAIVIILGALRMRQLENMGLGVTASIMAALPVHPWFLIGLPIGIWSLFVLSPSETKEAFRRQQRAKTRNILPTPPAKEQAAIAGKPAHIDSSQLTDALRTPAIALVVVGAVNVGLTILSFLVLFWGGGMAIFALIVLMVPLLISLVQLKGGVHMLRHQSYAVSMLGAIAAVLPLTHLWFVSLPLGIWALVLLQRQEVQQHYSDAAGRRRSAELQGRGGVKWMVLAALLMVGLLGGALVGILTYRGAARPARVQQPPHPQPVMEQPLRVEEISVPQARPLAEEER